MTDYSSITNIQQRQLAFLEDTVNFYTTANRGVKNGTCFYSSTETSPGCAIGRHLQPDVAKSLDSIGNISLIYEAEKDELLPSWMREMSESFLLAVQRLHDNLKLPHSYWNETGLSEDGKVVYEQIKKHFSL